MGYLSCYFLLLTTDELNHISYIYSIHIMVSIPSCLAMPSSVLSKPNDIHIYIYISTNHANPANRCFPRDSDAICVHFQGSPVAWQYSSAPENPRKLAELCILVPGLRECIFPFGKLDSPGRYHTCCMKHSEFVRHKCGFRPKRYASRNVYIYIYIYIHDMMTIK